MRRLNFNHLYYFWVVARLGSVTGASREIHVTQPTISAQIKQLEQALGTPLFSRAGGRLQLTATGQTVMRHADEMFGLGQSLLASLSGESASQPRRFVIGIAEAIPKIVVRSVLAALSAGKEGSTFLCVEWRGEQLMAEFSLRRVDIAITDAPIPPSPHLSAVECQLSESAISICGVPALAERARDGFPASLSGAPMVLPAPGTALRQKLQAWLEANSLRPRIVAEVEDRALSNYLGQSGLGLIPVAGVIEEEIMRQFGIERVGWVRGVREQYYATALASKLEHPAIAAIFAAAREQLVTPPEVNGNGAAPVSRRSKSSAPRGRAPAASPES